MIRRALLALFEGIMAFLFRLGVRFKSLLVNSVGYLVNRYTILLVVCHMILVFLVELWILIKKRSTDFSRCCVKGIKRFLKRNKLIIIRLWRELKSQAIRFTRCCIEGFKRFLKRSKLI